MHIGNHAPGLTGELRGWPGPWFNKSSGVVGITWFLPPLFGFYFAWKLWREGERIERVNRAFALALLGVVLNQVLEATVFEYAHISIYSMLLILWMVAIVSAYLQYLAWPALFKALIAYGFGAQDSGRRGHVLCPTRPLGHPLR